jgi:DNA-binding PadR family transcriptional regulator
VAHSVHFLSNVVESLRLQSTPQVVAGRARRTYVATAKGRKSLESAKHQLRELADEVLGDERG